MPIEKPTHQTAPVNEINEDFKIVRYLDIIKFLSMLQNESIFFCRLDKLEDRFEGTSPKPNREYQKNYYRSIYRDLPSNFESEEEFVAKRMHERIDMENRFRKICCISCWNKFENESYAMWKIYSDMNKGIMITSSIENLRKAFQETPETVQLTRIDYINHETDFIANPGNLNSTVLHKNIAYSFEEEIRLMYTVNTVDSWDYDWESEKNKNGKSLKINLDYLIDEIVLSPFAEPWYFMMIENLLEKYGLKKKLKYSILK